MAGEAERFFDAIAARYDREYALDPAMTRARMARVIAELPRPPARVLDLGVGTGRELSALLDAGLEVTGVDVSSEMLARCARRARPIPLVRADFWAPLPLPDESFDAALALHGTLAHPPDDAAYEALGAELARVVVPGGVVVAEVPAPAWLDAAESLPQTDRRRVTRTAAGRCVFEDRVADIALETRLLDADEWSTALGPRWITRASPLGALEWLVVARRPR